MFIKKQSTPDFRAWLGGLSSSGSNLISAICYVCDLGHLFVSQSTHLESRDPKSLHVRFLHPLFVGILCVSVTSPPSTLSLTNSAPAPMASLAPQCSRHAPLQGFCTRHPSAWKAIPPEIHMAPPSFPSGVRPNITSFCYPP